MDVASLRESLINSTVEIGSMKYNIRFVRDGAAI